jgi:DNA-binding GntR family transcriptional regulator
MTTGSATVAAAAALRLRQDIVSGALPPAQRLKMRELEARYGIGATPLREALVGLAAKGFVVAEGQKGFRVPPVERQDLLDLTCTRQIVEAEALRLALEHGDTGWEDEIVASFHLLKRELERQEPESEAWLDEYEARHHRFHRALIAACPLTHLRGFCDDLYARKVRYRRVLRSFGKGGSASIAAHQTLMDLALARRPEPALADLRRHIGATAKAVLTLLEMQRPPGKV